MFLSRLKTINYSLDAVSDQPKRNKRHYSFAAISILAQRAMEKYSLTEFSNVYKYHHYGYYKDMVL